MKFGYIFIVAFIFLAEENIISNYRRYGTVNDVSVNSEMLEKMEGVIENIDEEDLKEHTFRTVYTAMSDIFNIALSSIKEYGKEICDISKELPKDK